MCEKSKKTVYIGALAIAAAAVISSALALPTGEPGELGKELLSPDDFEFVGAFYLPGDQPDPNVDYWHAYYQGLTHRYVDGKLKLYTIPGPYASVGHLMEFEVPETTSPTLPYPRQNAYISFGDIYQDKITQTAEFFTPENPAVGLDEIEAPVQGIFWDEQDQRMYWTKLTSYDMSYLPDTAVGYAVLDDVTHTGVGVGNWVIPADKGARFAFSFAAIPLHKRQYDYLY
ncbi:MAG: hypothetical protein LBT26_05415 [Clostridiales Family XIII bacterium]|nr:hypothetical protein [Clostridiales Family XIII bacterium]